MGHRKAVTGDSSYGRKNPKYSDHLNDYDRYQKYVTKKTRR